MYDFSNLKNKIKETEEWLSREFSQIRTGRATPNILDGVSVEAYGSQMPINQLATISAEDARTMRISPFDPGNIKPIEKAIMVSNLGLSVSVDERGLRVSFPSLTGETRAQFVKIAKQKAEDAKVALRHERNGVNDDLQAQKKDGSMGEDEMMRNKVEMEKIVKAGNEKIEAMREKKENEILG
jgi:ribosome recycling factor